MAVVRLGKLVRHLENRAVFTSFVRTHYWNKDFKPGPIPTTPEEHAAAAKKYGMIPEDYKTYPVVDGFSYGDYPNLEDISAESRNPYEDYDDFVYKRNWSEPLNRNFDIFGEDRYYVNERKKDSYTKQWITFLSVFFGAFALYTLAQFHQYKKPMLPKQYPYQGEVHYTFEPLNETHH